MTQPSRESLRAARAGEALDVERLARALVASGLMRRYADYANSLPTMKHGDENELAADWAFHVAREYAAHRATSPTSEDSR